MSRAFVVSVETPNGVEAAGLKAADDDQALAQAAQIIRRKLDRLQPQALVEIMRDDATMMDVRITVEDMVRRD